MLVDDYASIEMFVNNKRYSLVYPQRQGGTKKFKTITTGTNVI
jgi:hypothetical protein